MNLIGGDLRWRAPPEVCPGLDEVQRRIDAAGGLGELVVDGEVVEDPQGWRLELRISLGEVSDVRTLQAEGCDALAESLVLLVATRLDEVDGSPSVPEPEPEPAPEPGPPLLEPEPEPEPTPAVSSPVEPPSEPPSRSSLPSGVTLGLSAGASLGAVPTVGVPTDLGVGYAWPRVRVALRGRLHVGPTVAADRERDMRVLLGTAGPQVCARLGRDRLEFPLCAEVLLGGSRANMDGPAARDRGGLWLEAGLGAGLAWFFRTQWAVTAGLSGTVPLVGTGFELDGDEVWAPAPVGGRVMLGVEFLWPIQIGARPENST